MQLDDANQRLQSSARALRATFISWPLVALAPLAPPTVSVIIISLLHRSMGEPVEAR